MGPEFLVLKNSQNTPEKFVLSNPKTIQLEELSNKKAKKFNDDRFRRSDVISHREGQFSHRTIYYLNFFRRVSE
jgi:hypothetical protein